MGTLQSIVESCENKDLSKILAERYMSRLGVFMDKFTKYQGLIEHVVDMSRLPDLEINPRHDPELAELREETDSMDAEVDRYISPRITTAQLCAC
jgi:hypothetical protein